MSENNEKILRPDFNEIFVSVFEKLHNFKILIILPLILVAAIVFTNRSAERVIFPSSEFDSISPYTDSSEIEVSSKFDKDSVEILDSSFGNSQVTNFEVSDSTIKFSYLLRMGVKYPYAGISIKTISAKSSIMVDFSKYDSLEISLETPDPVNLALNSYWDGVTVLPTNPTGRLYQSSMLIKGDTTVGLEKFITPDWWFKNNNISIDERSKMGRDLSQVFSFGIENSDYENPNNGVSVVVDKISLKKDLTLLNRTALISLIFYVLLYSYFWKFGTSHLGGPVVIPYRELKVRSYVDEDSQKIKDYVAENFSNVDLTVKQASIDTAITQAKIQVILRTQFKMTFRQYLNRIKIHESKRLLLETDRQVTDIAFRVGYKNVTHYNRIFKEMEEVSPNQYRKANGVK
jgi:AraC-like DNA-binding protein